MEKYREPFLYLTYFEELTGKDTKVTMTHMIQKERFSSGAIASYAQNGFFEQALRRLGKL